MEHGSFQNPSSSTFSITEEDHTLANSLRVVLNQDPRVSFCGYSIPHPSEARVNIRVQTTESYEKIVCIHMKLEGDPACEVLKDGCQNLSYLCKHVRKTFDDAVAKYKTSKANDSVDVN